MFEIQRMGCSCRHGSSFLLDQPQGYDVYLMLFVKTRAVFRLDGEYRLAEPSTFILYDRNTPLYYGASGGDYINDWALFDCTEPLQAEAKVRFNELIPIGEQIDLPQYFQLIADSFFRGANTNSAGLLIRAMLTEIFSAPVSKGWTDLPHYRELLDLRRQLYAQPDLDWDAQKMAQQVNISVPYLHALYKKAFGVTCAADVVRSRMEQAKQLLGNPAMTVEDIAFACGYHSSVHFSRQFKQQFGVSPMQWRKTGGQ